MSVHSVYKIVLKPQVGAQEIELQQGFEILHVDYQHGMICLWYRCVHNALMVKRTVLTAETGAQAPAPDEATHLGTVLLASGRYVLHFFMKRY